MTDSRKGNPAGVGFGDGETGSTTHRDATNGANCEDLVSIVTPPKLQSRTPAPAFVLSNGHWSRLRTTEPARSCSAGWVELAIGSGGRARRDRLQCREWR